MYRKFFKRALDILLSAAGTLVLSPLFLLISAAVKLEDHGPAVPRNRVTINNPGEEETKTE